MIRIVPPGTAFIQRLRQRAGQIAARRLRAIRHKPGGRAHQWRSASALWPDFLDDTPRS